MSLKESVRQKFEEAKRLGNREEKNLDVEKLLRKMVESNTETVNQMKSHHRGDDPQLAVLEQEIAFLKTILPQMLDAEAIVKALEPVRAEIVNAKNDGQATGVAMKHLKGQSLSAQGQDAAAAVKQIRAGK